MLAAGLLAKKAVERGLKVKPYVKTSLAPGIRVVTDYLDKAGLDKPLRAAGLPHRRLRLHDLHRQQRPAARAGGQGRDRGRLVAAAVLSGNRNFEGRINPLVKANYLASPPLVVAYALAGTVDHRPDDRAAGHRQRRPAGVSEGHLAQTGRRSQTRSPGASSPRCSASGTANVFDGERDVEPDRGRRGRLVRLGSRRAPTSRSRRSWSDLPPSRAPIQPIRGARVLAVLGDSVTTDHISPAGSIAQDSPAGKYLQEQGVAAGRFQQLRRRAAATTG